MSRAHVSQRTDGFFVEVPLRQSVPLVGLKNGSNSVYSTPDKFLFGSNFKIVVVWNGRELRSGQDYTVHEGGGAGTGYNEIRLTGWASAGFLPRATDDLVASYHRDPNF